MHEVTVFENPEFGSVRTLLMDGEPWWVGKDVAAALGYKDAADAVKRHTDSEDRGVGETPTPSGTQTMTIINESGLYSLILSSKLPSAKAFKRWITSEVLPSIRKTGAYGNRDSEIDVETIIRCAEIMCTCRPENKPEVTRILKNILPDIDTLERIREPEPPEQAPHTPDADGCIVDSIGRRQPPRDGCAEPFDSVKLYKLCVKRNLRDKEIAKGVGCSTCQIYKWRNGRAKPTAFYRWRLCEYLGVPKNYFTPEHKEGKK